MGVMSDGIKSQIDFSGFTTTDQVFDALLAAIPNPDGTNAGHTGIVQGIMGFLDEMSPITAAELRVELLAAKTKAAAILAAA